MKQDIFHIPNGTTETIKDITWAHRGRTKPKRTITPHKGGRTICKSTNVTWKTDIKLRKLKELDGSSLGDVIEWAVNQLVKD